MATDDSQTANAVTPPDNGAKPTVADSIVEHTDALATHLIWDGENSYIIVKENSHVRTLAVRSKAFRRWMIGKMRDHGVRIPSSREQWETAADRIDSHAEEGGVKPTPTIRIAGTWDDANKANVILIDLGDADWNCVRITRDGWSIEPHPADGPYFYRPPRMAPLPMPVAGGKLDRLYHFLNAETPLERMLLPAWVVQANWPKGPYPILTAHGPAGSAKTTRVAVSKALTDPTISSEETAAVTSPRKPPRNEQSIIAAARNGRIIAYDNVSYLDNWLSDALCRLATGAELGDRGLYTDFDEAVFTACRPIVMNGIPDVVNQSDLADRCVQTETSKPEVRQDEPTFWKEFRAEWPMLFGVVLNLISAVLRNWTEAGKVIDGVDVRMRNYARIGEALGLELGWERGAFTHAYLETLTNAAHDIAVSHPIFRPLLHVLGAKPFEGTHQELLDALNLALPIVADGRAQEISRSKPWPTTPKAMSNTLARLGTPLEKAGIVVGEQKRSNGVTIRRLELAQVHDA